MYWIEVYFENGKTLRKESESLNETYKVLARYDSNRSKQRVQGIRAGRDDSVLLHKDLTEKICM
jgi:hypothetical protein